MLSQTGASSLLSLSDLTTGKQQPMMSNLKLLISIYYILDLVISQCIYTDPNTQQKLYLDALSSIKLIYHNTQESDGHTYTYTPCRNAAEECPDSEGSGGLHTSMCSQTLDHDPTVCNVIANIDSSVVPEYDPNNQAGTWTFNFANGDNKNCGTARKFNVYFYCDMNAGDYTILNAGITIISIPAHILLNTNI